MEGLGGHAAEYVRDERSRALNCDPSLGTRVAHASPSRRRGAPNLVHVLWSHALRLWTLMSVWLVSPTGLSAQRACTLGGATSKVAWWYGMAGLDCVRNGNDSTPHTVHG